MPRFLDAPMMDEDFQAQIDMDTLQQAEKIRGTPREAAARASAMRRGRELMDAAEPPPPDVDAEMIRNGFRRLS